MITLARLYQTYSARFYLVCGGNEEKRRSKLDEEFLEPYKLLGDIIQRVAGELGDQDIV